MGIIKHGNTYRKYTCYNCQCEFYMARNELTRYWNKADYYVYCPECDNAMIYTKEEIENGNR